MIWLGERHLPDKTLPERQAAQLDGHHTEAAWGKAKSKGKDSAKAKVNPTQQVADPNSKTSMKKAERVAKGKGKDKGAKPHL